jgi:alkyl hydroperoxide reductase subunit AhpF
MTRFDSLKLLSLYICIVLPKNNDMQKHNRDNKRENPQIEGQYDYVVVGGGLSGLCSAVMAARKGVISIGEGNPIQ